MSPIGDLNVIGQRDILIDDYPLAIESWSGKDERVPLAPNNTLRLVRGESIVIRANRFAANETMEAWLFSNPVLVGNAPTDGAVVSCSIPVWLSSVMPKVEA